MCGDGKTGAFLITFYLFVFWYSTYWWGDSAHLYSSFECWWVGGGGGGMRVGEGEGGCKTHLVAGVQYIKNQFGILPHMWGTLPF